nr:hypothetical protein [Candidatus Sigynarchaeota archaeon]
MDTESINAIASSFEAKGALQDDDVFMLIATFNHEMLGNVVDAPNCTDKQTCKNNCCSIMIDIPHCLAKKYIDDGRLNPDDLRRGDVFAWKLNASTVTSKCVFFSPEIYGCRIYVDDLNSRPPQCAVYPAGYTAGATTCKVGAGPWIVKDEAKGNACKQLMDVYTKFCIEERLRVKEALIKGIAGTGIDNLATALSSLPPWSIAGVKDTWTGLKPLLAEGKSFSFKAFCPAGCTTDYFACTSLCKVASRDFVQFLNDVLPNLIKDRDMKEDYTIMELKEFSKTTGEKK